MWSFLAALGIGAYLCGKYSADKKKTETYDRKSNKEREIAEAFFMRYSIDRLEENTIKDMILNANPEMVEFSEKLEKIIGMKPTHPMRVWGFIAQSGKIPSKFTATWYNADSPLANDHDLIWMGVEPWNSLKVEEMRAARLKFLQWYDRELRANGMEYRLMYAPCRCGETNVSGDYVYHVEDAKDIAECRKVFPAAIFWNPARLYAPRLFGVV